MNEFWDKVHKVMEEWDHETGYLEIESDGKTYRSVPSTHNIKWVCWEPFEIITHFSWFKDPNATIRRVE